MIDNNLGNFVLPHHLLSKENVNFTSFFLKQRFGFSDLIIK